MHISVVRSTARPHFKELGNKTSYLYLKKFGDFLAKQLQTQRGNNYFMKNIVAKLNLWVPHPKMDSGTTNLVRQIKEETLYLGYYIIHGYHNNIDTNVINS